MAITPEQVKDFINEAKKAREPWLVMANRSWDEIKKRQRNQRLWSVTPNSVRKRARYPAWYSIFKIRQPLILSRVGIPIGKDTTQDGIDNVGATAAICLERLAINLAKSFDFFDVMCACRDDFLATNFAQCRAYYEREAVRQEVKEYITPEKVPTEDGGEEVLFFGADGEPIESDDIGQDDQGYFIQHEETIDVENEKICLEPVLYRKVYIDPGISRWKRCKRMAFEEEYSEPEFKDIFGAAAFNKIPKPDTNRNESEAKKQNIVVYEYWDCYEKQCYWLPENGDEFIKPKSYMEPDYEEEVQEYNGLYNLDKFFPTPAPIIMNAPTDEFWPVPEYYQLIEILDDIHTIFSRLMALTKAIRARILFDNNVEGLQSALNEATEGDAIGVDNLAQSLSGAGGTLEGVVQYIPVEKLINGLQQLYGALEQRLNIIYKLTGTSDLLQGLVTDPTQRTFGERQMTEKYALNQLAEPQRKMQDFVRDSYQLICEMALKNFKDASLDSYIMPATLGDEHKERYHAAMGLLKSDTKRFRIELETDSTIALNEQYDKQMRMELVNTLTAALEKTANIATTSPALIVPELHCLKYLVQGFRQGKMFQSEVTQAIDNTIQAAEAQQGVPAFNKEEAQAQLEAQKLQADLQIEQAKLQSNERLELGKLQQLRLSEELKAQLEQYKIQVDEAREAGKLQLDYQKLSAAISEAQNKLVMDREELMLEFQKSADKRSFDEFKAMLDERVATYEQQLAESRLQLETYRVQMDEQEKYMTEERLQSEHQLDKMRAEVEYAMKVAEAQRKIVEAQKPPEMPPITVHAVMPQPAKKKKKIKITRDESGNIKDLEAEDTQEPGI